MDSPRIIKQKIGSRARRPGLAAAALGLLLMTAPAAGWAALGSLKTTPVPEPPNLGNYVVDRTAAIQLGKALYWDMQVGSDGVQACGTCHFHAGADSRARNAINPGTNGGDSLFGNNLLGLPPPAQAFGPDSRLTRAHFPLHKLVDPDQIGDPAAPATTANAISDCNDVISSMGPVLKRFVDIVPGNPVDLSAPLRDPVFRLNNKNVRRVEPRHTPSVINAVFNFNNFWDGRANNIFNGVSPFGPADPEAVVFTNRPDNLLGTEFTRLRQASLASQAVGPPLSDSEMSWQGRTWPKIGKKLLSLTPLGQQVVHPQDSVLGPLANATALNPTFTGLKLSYEHFIERAFRPKYWANNSQHLEFVDPLDPGLGLAIVDGPADPANTGQFSQMEANFALFFGLAVQLYEATLVADDSLLDRFLEGNGALTIEQARGMNIFVGPGGCIQCHDGPETTDIATAAVQGANPITGIPQPLTRNPLAANEYMAVLTGAGFYDLGFHNSGVRPGGATNPVAPEFLAANEDIGRGGDTDFLAVDPLNPVNTFPIPLSHGNLAMWKLGAAGTTVPVPAALDSFIAPLPLGFRPAHTLPYGGRVANHGAFKTPGLRNIELTGPYMHNGGLSTLHQVVEFYARGGDFPVTNRMDFDPGLLPIGFLADSEQRQNDLVAFMLTMTDQRVKNESAPFDHPEIFVPNHGLAPVSPGTRAGFLANRRFLHIPAVGAGGLSAEGLPAIGTFLNLNPFRP